MNRDFEKLAARAAPAIFVVLWSTGFIATKYVLHNAEPLTYLAIRMALVVALMAIIIAIARPVWPNRSEIGHSIIAGILVHGFYLGGTAVAISHSIPAGLSALIPGLQPILTSTLANRWLGERVTPLQWIGLLLGLAFGAWLGVKQYRYTFWRLDDTGLAVRRGRLWQRETRVPTTRVQHLDLKRGPLQRGRHLATLVVHTAGTRNSAVSLPHLDGDDAERLRDRLARQIDHDDDGA